MLVKHLNSPLFQRRYLRKENDDIKPAEPTDSFVNQTDGAVSADSKNGYQSTTAASTNGSTNKEADTANLVNENSICESVNSITASSTTLDKTSALDGEKASLDAVDDDHIIESKNAQSNGDQSKSEEPDHSDVEVTAKGDDGVGAPEAPEQSDLELFPDDDDEDDGQDSEIFDEPVADNARAPVRPQRYELSYWPSHLARAEKLWTTEEREKSDEWKELWKLVVQFLCESPDAFKTWQQHYMRLDENYFADNTLLSPLQVAAAYGISGLVKILLDRGEPAAAELEDGRSALWFAANSPDIEIITLLLAKGASPNAHKVFPPPFHVLLWWNPKLEFVNLMLEHGAACNITDHWGFNVMHWFAFSGSDVEVLKALLRAHGDINILDSIGETPLHKLMYNSQGLSLDLLRAFLANGADVNKDDSESQSKPRNLLYLCNALTSVRASVRGLRSWKYGGGQDIA